MFRYLKYLALTATSWALSSSDDILVGGQAVIEGVMMRSPKGYSVAVRRPDGSVGIIKDVLQTAGEKWRVFKLPVLRGVGVLGQALVLGIKALRYSAEEAMVDEKSGHGEKSGKGETAEVKAIAAAGKDPTTKPSPVSSWLIAASLVPAMAINIGIFIVLPLFLTRYLQTHMGFQSQIMFNSIDGVFRVGMFVGFLYVISRMSEMNRVFQYHGAEHKTVFNFEARESLELDNARKYSTFHPRCGTSFLMVVMVVSIVVFSLVHFDSITAKLLSRIALMPLIAGISYEVIRYSAKHPGSLMRWITLPGLLLQRITTKEPDDRQLETAIRALEEALTV
jgi:uncharacterized protein YqhQ